MSKKSKRKANLKASILVLLLLAILLMASTYAWFTSNTQVTISTLNVNVEAKNGLQISADGTNWKTILETADIDPTTVSATYTGNTNQIPTIMEPVSSAGNVNTADGTLNMFYGMVEADETSGKWELTATKETDAKGTVGKYIAFDIFLRVDTESQLSLTQASGVSDLDASGKGLENATRVAFVVEGNQPVGTDLTTIQGLKGATDDTTYIWEPNSDAHTAAAQANANDNYGVPITVGDNVATQVKHYGIKAVIDDGIELIDTHTGASPDYFTQVDTIQTSKTMSDTELLTLSPGITKVRVYMWVEGQDFDCDNSASGSNLSFDLQFSVPA